MLKRIVHFISEHSPQIGIGLIAFFICAGLLAIGLYWNRKRKSRSRKDPKKNSRGKKPGDEHDLDDPENEGTCETDVPGVYIAGELGGAGLFRNAIRHGAIASRQAMQDLDPSIPAVYDLFIVGAGPAGLSASLAAIEAKKKFRTIDQNTLVGTVANYPWQKIVMSHPADLPILGKTPFKSNEVSKEDLIQFWKTACEKTGLCIYENERLLSFKKDGGTILVTTSEGEFSARRLLLCMGVQGSPVKLGLPNEDLPNVTYRLADPEQYQGQHVAVVGGGNSATRTALQLATTKYRNHVTLLVRGDSLDGASNENQTKIQNLQNRGQLQIWFDSCVKEIRNDSLSVEQEGLRKELPNDYLFICTGTKMPQEVLQGLRIKTEKEPDAHLKKSA